MHLGGAVDRNMTCKHIIIGPMTGCGCSLAVNLSSSLQVYQLHANISVSVNEGGVSSLR